ncbi:MAG: birA, biotin-(acetyl-CoA-carboxylase) ligase [Actinomycetia bacterium]|jgi:BirA family biotin operon repressor/biotin-[acetyl-CoA-carboxylase] ligase|nr:birA, biotin-(acetyl-CoA-carboxylase) ligase [Actinomycetes bacterium]
MMRSDAPAERNDGLANYLHGTRFGPIEWFRQLDSTNRYASEAAIARAGDGLVVVADEQTAGRGRLGRTWEAPPGASLLVSVLLRMGPSSDLRALATPAAALAAADALHALAGIDARLKWPNDLVVGERKIAGFLAEAVHGASAVVVGMGLNVSWPAFPDELADIATAANHCSDRPVDREPLLIEWLVRYDRRLRALAHPGGERELRDACAARSATLGRRVRVELSNRALVGLASGLTSNGMLEVTSDDGAVEAVASGDVVHLRPA